MVRYILLYGCETWSVRVADERVNAVFDNDSIRLTSIPTRLVQRRFRWFGHAARRPDGEGSRAYFCLHHLARGAGKLSITADLEALSNELAQDYRA